MTKKQKRWVYSPKKSPVHEVPETVKADVGNKANELIESFLKPTYIKPPPEDDRFNYLVDISSKWYRNYFYFCNRYNCPGPNAIRPYFDDKFARLEYVGKDTYNLSYMRHTGKWQPVYYELTLEECLQEVRENPLFQP
jgi:hypothetical protein